MVLYIFGRAVCLVPAQVFARLTLTLTRIRTLTLSMVPAQVQSLEPFPTRAASAAGLAGAMRMATVSLVAIFA